MKSILLLLMMAFTLPMVCFAQVASQATTTGGNPQQALMQIEQELVTALTKGDAAPFERYLADTYSFTGPDGSMQTKAQLLSDLRSGALKMVTSANRDMKVQLYGDTAIVTYSSTDKGTYQGTDISGQYRWTDVFVKRNGTWQLVSGQGTRMGKP